MRPSGDSALESLAELQAQFSRAMLETRLEPPPGLAPARRFSVHRNNLYASLTDALRARYPAIERLVGEDFFQGAASLFIEVSPPSTPVLIEYGEAFPAFLESFAGARVGLSRRCGAPGVAEACGFSRGGPGAANRVMPRRRFA